MYNNGTLLRIAAILALLCASSVGAWAQYGPRKYYPQPVLTDAVRILREGRTVFIPQADDGVVLPDHVDNSRQPYFPPVFNQSGGSCAQASGIGYMFTYEINRMLDRNASASPANRFAYMFTWNMVNDGEDEGGFVEQGLNIAQRYGVVNEADFGQQSYYSFAWPSGYDKYFEAMHYRASEVLSFRARVSDIKRYLYDAGCGQQPGGVVTFSTQSRDWIINDYYSGPSATGYKSLLTRLATDGAHALTIVGYDDLVAYTDDSGTTHQGAFIVVNSWGTSSHDNGRFYLPYHFFENPSVSAMQLSEKLNAVRVCTYEPKIVFKVNLTYDSRNDLQFATAATADRNAVKPAYRYDCPIFYHQGGDHPMQGQYRKRDIEIAVELPLASFPEPGAADDFQSYFLVVSRGPYGKKTGTGQVNAVSVMDYRHTPVREYKCTAGLGTDLRLGGNIFKILCGPRLVTSASPYNYTRAGSDGMLYLLRTAKGRHAKFQVTQHDASSHRTTIHYAVQPR